MSFKFFIFSIIVFLISGQGLSSDKNTPSYDAKPSTLAEFHRRDCPSFSGKWAGTCMEQTGTRSLQISQDIGSCALFQVDSDRILVGGISQESTGNDVETSYRTSMTYWSKDRKKLEIDGTSVARSTNKEGTMRFHIFHTTYERTDNNLLVTTKRIEKKLTAEGLSEKPSSQTCTYTLEKP